ncbi:MAG TPA: HgcAB-associated protein [Spirochaetia bacterium]|nr:HgcAB-associated protein [Spirochaetia bacterium]
MKRNKPESSCGPGGGCCSVESVVSVDDRGQMVLPKEIRERANIKAGDKLAVVGWEKEGQICCISLIKADQLGGMVRGLLGPMLKDLNPVEEEVRRSLA